MTTRVLAHIRRRLLRGVILVLPLLITLWLLSLLFNVINRNVAPFVRRLIGWSGIPWTESWSTQLAIAVVSLVLTAVAIYLLGLVAGNLVGRRLLTLVESGILRIPLVKGIYGAARQLLDAFGASGTRTFSKVVLLEYPRAGLWTLGFVTTEVEHKIEARGKDRISTVPVFLPTTPNPTSGWMILVPTSDLRELDISIEDAIKLIVSGGIVAPDDIGSLAREWSGGRSSRSDG
jgi:uncharacterized membrane protein